MTPRAQASTARAESVIGLGLPEELVFLVSFYQETARKQGQESFANQRLSAREFALMLRRATAVQHENPFVKTRSVPEDVIARIAGQVEVIDFDFVRPSGDKPYLSQDVSAAVVVLVEDQRLVYPEP